MNEEWLYSEYVVKDRSTQDIADEYGCKRNTIQHWLSRFEIKKDKVKRNIKHNKPYQNQDYLFKSHIVDRKPISQIAEENGVSYDAIMYFCKKYNITTWNEQHKSGISDDQIDQIMRLYNNGMSTYRLEQLLGIGHSRIKELLVENNVHIRDQSEAQFNSHNRKIDDRLTDKDWLSKQHLDCNKSCQKIAEELNIDAGTVRRHMKKLGIRTKTNSESKIGLMAGEKHPNWKGGVTPLNLLLREFFHVNLVPIAAARDNYACQTCGAQHTVLHVHHIVRFSDIVESIVNEHSSLDVNNSDDRIRLYNLITTDRRFLDVDNLITLCKQCHTKIHSQK